MIYKMKLKDDEFNNIKNGYKEIEVRLYDEKRKQIKTGDYIVFNKLSNMKDQIYVQVNKIAKFDTFKQVYNYFPREKFGYCNLSDKDILQNIYGIYTKQQELMYGVIAIEFTVVENMI